MTTKIEFYDRLREHLPEPAARLIAEEIGLETDAATKSDIENLRLATKADIADLRSSMFRFLLLFFVPLWIGVYGTLVAVLVRGS